MNLDDVQLIKEQAIRVLNRCEQWTRRYAQDDDFKKYCNITGYKESAAIKRALLDFKYDLRNIKK